MLHPCHTCVAEPSLDSCGMAYRSSWACESINIRCWQSNLWFIKHSVITPYGYGAYPKQFEYNVRWHNQPLSQDFFFHNSQKIHKNARHYTSGREAHLKRNAVASMDSQLGCVIPADERTSSNRAKSRRQKKLKGFLTWSKMQDVETGENRYPLIPNLCNCTWERFSWHRSSIKLWRISWSCSRSWSFLYIRHQMHMNLFLIKTGRGCRKVL
jgi:hypothetical protein